MILWLKAVLAALAALLVGAGPVAASPATGAHYGGPNYTYVHSSAPVPMAYNYDELAPLAQVTGGASTTAGRAGATTATPSVLELSRVAANTASEVATVTQRVVHGNSASSPATAYLYRLSSTETGYLKTGISQNPMTRYSQTFMQDKTMEILQSGTRREMLNLDRFIVERDPGPLNFERWAGQFAGDVP